MKLTFTLFFINLLLVQSTPNFEAKQVYHISEDFVGVELRLKDINNRIRIEFNGNCSKLSPTDEKRWIAVFQEKKVQKEDVFNLSRLSLDIGGVIPVESMEPNNYCKIAAGNSINLILNKELIVNEILNIRYCIMDDGIPRWQSEKIILDMHSIDSTSLLHFSKFLMKAQTSH